MYLNYMLLKPDINTKMLKMYHLTSKAFIPLGISSTISYYVHLNCFKERNKLIPNTIYLSTICNMCFHSYFSTSSIITDYIKHKQVEKLARITNVKLHTLSTLGFIYYINK